MQGRLLRFRSLAILLSVVSLSRAFLLPQRHQYHVASSNSFPSTKLESKVAAAFLTGLDLNSKLACAPLHATGMSSTEEDSTIINADFRLSGLFLAAGLLLSQLPILKWILAPIVIFLGGLFLVQTFRLKFVCDSSAFELQNTTKESGENILVGGKNRWNYTSFVNYEFFPKGWIDQPQGPILVYFKENQTPSEKWNEGPGKSANSEEALAKGAKPGQVHFFPALCNCQQLRAEWERRGVAKL